MKNIILLFFFLLMGVYAQQYAISGRIVDGTGQSVIGATVYAVEAKKGVSTDSQGIYKLNLKPGKYNLRVSFVGYLSQKLAVVLDQNATLNINLEEETLNEVVIETKYSNQNVASTQVGAVQLDLQTLNTIPALFGEKDILKSLQLLPGVSGQEGNSTGFYVRGGNPDHNLILMDGTPIFNPSHVAGLVSVFNSDALQDVTLYKAGIPAKYGGRLASVTDIEVSAGNKEKFEGNVALGLLTSSFTLKGPLGNKNQGSWLSSVRISYFGIFPRIFSKLKVNLWFADMVHKFEYQVAPKDKISFTLYSSGDNLGVGSNLNFYFYNGAGSFKWKHTYSDKWLGTLSAHVSNYAPYYFLGFDEVKFKSFSGISDYTLRKDVNFFISPDMTLNFGGDFTYRRIRPGELTPREGSKIPEIKMLDKQALEAAYYVSLDYRITKWFAALLGFRHSFYTRLGSDKVYSFDEDGNQTGTTNYKSGSVFGFQQTPEPRAALNFTITKLNSIKVSYERTAQYAQLVQGNPIGQPTNFWFPSGGNIRHQQGNQYSVGTFNNFFDGKLETSVEGYYKQLYNQIDYRNGANTLLNEYIEGDMLFGKGRTYGMEFLVRKNGGKFTGWISYTLSASRRTFRQINEGREFPVVQDRTHDLSLVAIYTPHPRHTISSVFVYSTGNAVTLPSGKYDLDGQSILLYSERNGGRLNDYHRLDLAYTFKFKQKTKADGSLSRFENSITTSIYNTYNQRNPYILDFKPVKDKPGEFEAVQTSLFRILPSVSWNLKF